MAERAAHVLRVVFGTRAEADRAAESIHHAHGRIRGTTAERLGSFPAGTTYAADDPELLFLVTTSLIEVTSKLYGRYVRRLSFGEQGAVLRRHVRVRPDPRSH
jgi:uncharacterized protein (DUF2236 family)